MNKLLFFLLLISNFSFGQILDPVSWDYSKRVLNENEVELHFTAKIDKGWYLYSQSLPEEADAFPTTFTFVPDERYELIASVIEPNPIEKFDPNFEMILPYFEDEVKFIQKIKINSENSFELNGEISFMTCDNSQCVFPPQEIFSFKINDENHN